MAIRNEIEENRLSIIENQTEDRFEDVDLYYDDDELAKSILKKKYLTEWENSPQDLWTRLAWGAAQAEKKEDRLKYARLFYGLLSDFKMVCGGRINHGLGRDDINVSCSNCYVVPLDDDSLEGIYKCLYQEAATYKTGGGCGHDLSSLRPYGAPIKGSGGASCGPVGFMNLYSVSTETVQQKGRRGANMQSISISHPDVRKFITTKNDIKPYSKILKKLALECAKNYDDIKVLKEFIESKRNVYHSNISIRLTDDFMKAVDADADFNLEWGGEIYETIKARKLWDEIITNAWECAEPGLMFWDRMVEDNNLEYKNPIISSNPCIVGETLIAVADGRNAVSIEQLMKEGKNVPVYSTNVGTGKVEIKWGRNPRKTGEKKEVWKLILDDGSEFIATPDHRILGKDLKYRHLKDLKQGDSIFPFNSFDNNRYRQICNTGAMMSSAKLHRNRRQYRLIHEFYTNAEVDPKKFAIHHRNFNSKDDSIDNLSVIAHEEHRKIHSEKMLGKNNPYFRAPQEWRDNFRKLAVKNGLPVAFSKSCRFDNWSIFKEKVSNRVELENHKVVSVSFHGYEDVYNISVDDNENYHIITSYEDDEYIKSSGICVKNCSEIPLGAYGNCLLGHITLPRYCIKNKDDSYWFDKALFAEHVRLAVRLLDNVVTINDGKHATKEQNETALNERRIGLGITGLGDMFILLGCKYGSDESIKLVDDIMSVFRNAAYDETCNLAKEKGVFPWFDVDGVFKSKFVQKLPSYLKEKIKENGMRNGMLLTCAPVGSGSIIAQTSSGIEPVFSMSYTRRVKNEDCSSFEKHVVFHPLVKKLIGDIKDPEELPTWFVSAEMVQPNRRVAVQAAIQKYIDNSISSTVNLPANATKEDVNEVYMTAWKMGCKGITVYRKGTRDGILVSEIDTMTGTTIENGFKIYTKRPQKLEGETYKRKVDLNGTAHNCYITVNFFPGTNVPYELLMSEPHIDKEMRDIMLVELATRCTSMMLRHGIPVEYIIEQFEKINGQYLLSVPVNIASVLKNYTSDGGEGLETCDRCGEKKLKVEGGCSYCVNEDCQFSQCS